MVQKKISELPLDERPSYKIEHHPSSMSTRELLALQFEGENKFEIADKVLASCDYDLRRLGQTSLLEDIDGIGKVTAKRLLSAVQLGNKLANPPEKEPAVIHCPEDAADLVQYEMSTLDQEELRVIVLNTRNRVIKILPVYKGSLNASPVLLREIFRPAIKYNGASIIVVHNHPSGDVSPSPQDCSLTAQIVKAGKLLDIQVLDHLIIGANSFLSLNRRGLGFGEEDEEKFFQEVKDKRRIVAVSKPLPKIFQDIDKLRAESSEKVKLTVNKNGTVIATSLDIKPQKKEQRK
jgi:DNA repair protein RadC